MNINTLKDILDIIKPMKSDYVYIEGDFVYGTDESFVYLKVMRFDNINNICISFSVNNMAKFIKNALLEMNELAIYPNLLYSSFENSCNINNPDTIYNIKEMSNKLIMVLSDCKQAVINVPLRGNREFEDIVSLKTTQGAKMFVYDRFSMAMSNNLVPTNKSDKVSLNIYHLNTDAFLSIFTVTKKKNVIIDIYIMYKYLY